MDQRLKLHETLCDLLGSRNVYFNPPPSVVMKYPCIRYNLTSIQNRNADNRIYVSNDQYSCTVIDRDPGSTIFRKIIESVPYATLERAPYHADGLVHWPIRIYT